MQINIKLPNQVIIGPDTYKVVHGIPGHIYGKLALCPIEDGAARTHEDGSYVISRVCHWPTRKVLAAHANGERILYLWTETHDG